jgi:hypothetical protein
MLSMTYQPEQNVYAWAGHAYSADPSVPYVIQPYPVSSAAGGTVSGAWNDIILLLTDFSTGNEEFNHYRIAFFREGLYTESDGELDIVATLTTLRPETPDRNIQGIPKNIVDCLIRVRETLGFKVRPGPASDFESAPVEFSADESLPYTGNVKIVPRGNVNDDGQMTVVSDSGPCEIQCVVWKAEI